MAEKKKEIEIGEEQLHLNNCIVTGPDTSQKRTLQDIIGKSPKLVMKFSELCCMSCVNDIMEKLEVARDKIGPENIIVLTSYNGYRNFYIFYKKHSSRFTVYNVKDSQLGFRAENYTTPFLFTIDNQLKATNLFVPFKENPLSTVEYLYDMESVFTTQL